ncbi:Bug family tripartite tricarboxylate transporter substrate binding protein [Paracraurococcus ruber]|uniref:Twin-arginine translocation pathway signal protein n=1 Tax=Paracraurococcus ruber TaxID=77675 RepID=A0ABS1CUD5_9PROT|nr:tripartite tricarboxylate transporter substrate binding protein [Paracraurococcus ruber]MBK1657816.1 twin-arginine translocation pathway signal protein [Paracraurococcus ruber]TDG31406.1 tripartite tricarboxylate transporter substrate binding protein [Paracraurococcus ruber]
MPQPRSITRRQFGLVAAAGLALPAGLARAQGAGAGYPGSRPVTLVVSWAPGGSTDFVARVLAQGMSATLPGNVVVDNRPGASGTIGHASVARARPDGYTLLLGVNSTYAMARHLFPQRGYDDEAGFTGIGRVATTPIFLCVNNRLGVGDIRGFVALAKKDAGKLSYASSGAGSSAHLATELFLRSADIEVQNVTYRGGAPAVQALIAGEVQMAFVDAVTALPLIAAKQVTAIGVSSAQRNPLAPEIPTIAESGFPGYECSSDFALLAPAGLPDPIVQQLHRAKMAALQSPEVVEKLRNGSIFPDPGTPEAWPQQIKAESAKWGEVIKSRGITLE